MPPESVSDKQLEKKNRMYDRFFSSFKLSGKIAVLAFFSIFFPCCGLRLFQEYSLKKMIQYAFSEALSVSVAVGSCAFLALVLIDYICERIPKNVGKNLPRSK